MRKTNRYRVNKSSSFDRERKLEESLMKISKSISVAKLLRQPAFPCHSDQLSRDWSRSRLRWFCSPHASQLQLCKSAEKMPVAAIVVGTSREITLLILIKFLSSSWALRACKLSMKTKNLKWILKISFLWSQMSINRLDAVSTKEGSESWRFSNQAARWKIASIAYK